MAKDFATRYLERLKKMKAQEDAVPYTPGQRAYIQKYILEGREGFQNVEKSIDSMQRTGKMYFDATTAFDSPEEYWDDLRQEDVHEMVHDVGALLVAAMNGKGDQDLVKKMQEIRELSLKTGQSAQIPLIQDLIKDKPWFHDIHKLKVLGQALEHFYGPHFMKDNSYSTKIVMGNLIGSIQVAMKMQIPNIVAEEKRKLMAQYEREDKLSAMGGEKKRNKAMLTYYAQEQKEEKNQKIENSQSSTVAAKETKQEAQPEPEAKPPNLERTRTSEPKKPGNKPGKD